MPQNNKLTKKLNEASDSFCKAESKIFPLEEKLSFINPQLAPNFTSNAPEKINPEDITLVEKG